MSEIDSVLTSVGMGQASTATTYRVAGEGGRGFTRMELRDMIRFGSLSESSEIAVGQSETWQRAGEVPELKRYFDLAATSPGRTVVPEASAAARSMSGTVPLAPAVTAPQEGSMMGALLFGVVAMVGSAVAWAAITIATEYQIGFMAIGAGLLVGIAVRKGGGSGNLLFGGMGAGLALGACVLGNVLSGCWFVAQNQHVEFSRVLGALDVDLATRILGAMFEPIDLLFYGIALWEGFSLGSGLRRK